MAKCAFVGLGVMGFPMAGHLVAKGHEVTVYNRSEEKAKAWVEKHGGKSAPTPREAAQGQDFVMACVGNDEDLRSVVFGETGILEGLEKGRTFVDHTTASADVAREIDEAAKAKGSHFVDGPVSGGQAGAENGALTIMCGGSEAAFKEVEPVLDAYGKAVTYMGPAGSGQLAKMVNQICIAGLVQGLSEGLHFAQKSGLDIEKLLKTISKGAAASWQMDNRWMNMAQDKFDYGFAVNWMRKDLSICLAEARKNGAALPVTALVDQFYRRVQQAGGGRWDTSSLIWNLREENVKKQG